MKKLFAILLALMLVMVSAFALAEDGKDKPATKGDTAASTPYEPGTGADVGQDTEGSPRIQAALDNGGTITIGKIYNVDEVLEGAKVPGNSITFTPVLDSITDSTVTKDQFTELPQFSYAAPNEAAVTAGTAYEAGNITIKFPTYPEVGIYTYKVTETGGAYAGVTYSDVITMKVTVVRLEGQLKIAGIAFRTGTSNTKLSAIENKYEAGTLEVKKTVTGNMGDQNKPFEITVTFTAPEGKSVNSTIGIAVTGSATVTKVDKVESSATSIAPWGTNATTKEVTFTLKHNDTITFTNVPAGVQYEVTETSYASEDYDAANITSGSGTMAHTKVSAEVVNNKNVPIDTGVALETSAYVLIMALALAGFVMMVIRRREEY